MTPKTQVIDLRGDATLPQGSGHKIICHIVNDIGAWGAGFVVALGRRFPRAEQQYREWYGEKAKACLNPPYALTLGDVQFVQVALDTHVANIVGQHGIGSLHGPPVRYAAIEAGLLKAANFAKTFASKGIDCTLHMPKIGAGLAGGDWTRIRACIERVSQSQGVSATIYHLDLPPPSPELPGL